MARAASPDGAAGGSKPRFRPLVLTTLVLLVLTGITCVALLRASTCGSSVLSTVPGLTRRGQQLRLAGNDSAATLPDTDGATSSSSSSRQRYAASGTAAANTATAAAAPAAEGDIRLFVGVLSAASNVQARQAVRETWGADSRLARVVFVSLRPTSNESFWQLRKEAAQYSDVLVTSSVDEGYYNITYAVLDIFRAAAAMGPAVSHVMKTDDDCYVRVSPLLIALSGMTRHWLYAGWPMITGTVIRGHGDGWHVVPYSNWASDTPVRYGFGLGYVLSSDLAQQIAAGAPHVLMRPDNLLIIEDVAVGYIVDFIGRDQNVTVQYDDSMPMSVNGCRPQDIVVHIAQTPKWRVLRCMHETGGSCC